MVTKPRVRFAPSPTGSPHVGSVRSALFNWLFARKAGGTFVLRIEDTDRSRSTVEFEQEIFKGLKWLDLTWDEGPDIGGAYGPYRQMERLELYQQYLKPLLERKQAYLCYCSAVELEAERDEQRKRGEPPRYSGKCKKRSEQELNELKSKGRKPVVRFTVPTKQIIVHDLVRGEVTFDTGLFGDFVLVKSDGVPIFIFSNVVDDITMEISHVIRGEEHLSNTPKQILIYEALGKSPPQFAHLPIILGPDRSKLSKRHGAESIVWYRDQGYLAEALVNFLALLGWNPGDNREIFTREELIKSFSLERVQKSGAVFDKEKLLWMNGQYMRRLDIEMLTRLAVPFLEQAGLLEQEPRGFRLPNGSVIGIGKLQEMVVLGRDRAKLVAELPREIDFFLKARLHYDPKVLIPKGSTHDKTLKSLKAAVPAISGMDDAAFTVPRLASAIEALAGELHFSGKELLWPLRVALSGKVASPGLFEVMDILGKAHTLKRIQDAIQKLEITP